MKCQKNHKLITVHSSMCIEYYLFFKYRARRDIISYSKTHLRSEHLMQAETALRGSLI